MLTCKEVSFLASKKLDKKLTLREQIGFLFHMRICRLCRYYANDLKSLHLMMQKKGKTGRVLLSESTKLSEQSRARIKHAIDTVLSQ
ncbi:MAG: hypothetical protein L3J59_13665 [Methylococcaceae bacterium]|nr:hypothetical protein [Methylococcaceae bacterium]